ncbi:MAG: T9SS type A sorting domain-containing protein [Ignavibacteria bacterium]|nr:T9SS type A sorting domain-containing protein [Ignavibacteria bacterium]
MEINELKFITHKPKMKLYILYPVMITFLLLSFNAFGQEQIRIMSYNILNYPNIPGNDSIMVADTTARNPYYRTIFSSVNPDIALLQEIERKIDGTAFLTNVMNSYGETYEMGWDGTAGDDNPIYFKADKFDLISSYLVIDQAGGHPTVEYVLYHEQTGDTLIILNVHLTAGSTIAKRTARKVEADAIRARTSTYSESAYFIAMGDFNMFGGYETAFDTLLDQTNNGYFIDPLDLQGFSNWSASGLTEYNTSNTRSGFGNYLGGGNHTGLDERFDLLINSQNVVDPGGIMYKPGSYITYANDGLHNNRDINDQPNNAVPIEVADALYMASDHLPIYADFYIGINLSDSPTPGSIIFTQVGADNPDVVEFLTLAEMNLTELKITNSEVDINGDLVNGDGTFNLMNTPWTNIPAGTFVRLGIDLTNDNDHSDRIIQYDGAGSSAPTLYTGSTGDQLIAYTGSEAEPTYIAAIIWGNDGWLTGPSNSRAPGTPSDIELGTSDNYRFNGSVNGNADVTRTAIMNTSSWIGSGSRVGYVDLTGNIGNSAFPVELIFFAGTISGNNVELRWRTETELNNYGFDIERATENSDWLALGFVEGHGNSNSPKEYSFSDSNIGISDRYYYRLKQIDNDGTFEYSDIITVEVGVPDNFYLSQNYPNPFNPQTRIDFTIPEKLVVTLRVYNILGELVTELIHEEKDAGSYSIIFDASNLSSGIYVYRLETSDFIDLRKMTLLK